VDTHPIHFHAFDVQLLNRVGWDGAIRLPDANELGWKDTVRVSPLEDTIVALRPMLPKLPFGLPDSIRLLSPSDPIGSPMNFTNVDPFTAEALDPPTTNQLTNFGWEYVWHCHILSHEEDDMMRPIVMQVPRFLAAAPLLSVTVAPGGGYNLVWTDGTPANVASTLGNYASEIGFRIRRATGNGSFQTIATTLANSTTFRDATAASNTQYQYQVIAYNAAGDSPSTVVAPLKIVSTPATGVTLSASSPSPAVVGQPVTFTAVGSGSTTGGAPSLPSVYQYRFFIKPSTSTTWTLVQDWSAGSKWTMPGTTAAGAYNLAVHVRTNPAVTTFEAQGGAVWTLVAITTPATGVTLTPSIPSPVVQGKPVVFTAQGQGSPDPFQYRFFIRPSTSTTWTLVQDYGVGSSWTMPGNLVADTYTVVVHVRTSTLVGLDAQAGVTYVIRPAPATGVTLTPSLPSPQAQGTPVVFTAQGQGSSGYQYRFFIKSSTSATWTLVQDYGVGSSWTMPGNLVPDTYTVVVHVRTSTLVGLDAQVGITYAIRLPPATGVALTSSLPSPQVQGTPVVFTAQGQGSSSYQYRFYIRDLSTATYQLVQNYSAVNTWTMPASTPAANYRIYVHVRTDPSVGLDAQAGQDYSLTP
jgi:hypothetical protein